MDPRSVVAAGCSENTESQPLTPAGREPGVCPTAARPRQLTVDTYGKWLPMGNKAAENRLDDASGSKVVLRHSLASRLRWNAADLQIIQ